MSKKHPIVAVTGSSGAGTTTVKRAFEHIFYRDGINAAVIEGDSFHRYDRAEMKAQMRGLDKVTAEYSLRADGGVNVVNRGFSSSEGEWKEAVGKAFFVEDQDKGYLKVSFFGPFYGSYVVFELDTLNYQYAFISGSNTSYLWFLSRTPAIESDLKTKFIEKVEKLGFDPSELIWVKQ